MSAGEWQRVSKSRKCLLCQRADWCLIARDGSAAICAPVESPVRAGDAGYLHRLTERRSRFQKATTRTITLATGSAISIDFAVLAAEYRAAVNPRELTRLATALGVAREALERLQIGWDGQAWTFPMRDARGQIVGVRRRFADARKLSVKSGREGVFTSGEHPANDWLLIAEGPTDTAALLTLGFHAIGRPSCCGGVEILRKAARGKHAVIVADADTPGKQGATLLATLLVVHCKSVRIIEPPTGIKDARAWLCAGATMADVQSAIDRSEPINLKIKTRTAG